MQQEFTHSPASPYYTENLSRDQGRGPVGSPSGQVFNVSRATAKKWLKRDDVQDRSHRAHVLKTTLSTTQEAIVLALRQSLYLPLDDFLFVTKQYIKPDVSRSGLAHRLEREGVSRTHCDGHSLTIRTARSMTIVDPEFETVV